MIRVYPKNNPRRPCTQSRSTTTRAGPGVVTTGNRTGCTAGGWVVFWGGQAETWVVDGRDFARRQ